MASSKGLELLVVVVNSNLKSTMKTLLQEK